MSMLDNLVGVHDDRDKEGEHHVDEERAEEVEVRLAVHPHRPRLNKTGGNNGKIITDDKRSIVSVTATRKHILTMIERNHNGTREKMVNFAQHQHYYKSKQRKLAHFFPETELASLKTAYIL
jgi:hypothetical protein